MSQKPIPRDPGPQGPQGWTGLRGLIGPKGDDGNDGADGEPGPSFFTGSARFNAMGAITDAVLTGIISSVDYSEPGRYDIHLNPSEPDIFYNVQATCGDASDSQGYYATLDYGRKNTDAFRLCVFNAAGDPSDVNDIMLLISRPV